MYHYFIRPLLFRFDPEKIHHFTFNFLKFAGAIPGVRWLLRNIFTVTDKKLERTLFGIQFSNPVGLAAGFDKDARLIDELACFGFGFIEIGTLTPKAQAGNDKPRLFRLPQDQALINRMGFNNGGVAEAVERLKKRKSKVIIGGNIGKNKVTPNEKAFEDYDYCFQALYPYVDYFVVNVSSPNTPGLRELQEKEPLTQLMNHVKGLSTRSTQPKPVLLKIAPDLTNSQLDDVVEVLVSTKADGVIATNTTISRDGLNSDRATLEAIGNGGLSGKPLVNRSNEVIAYLRSKLGKSFPIIGVGGIMSPEDAVAKINAGADLIQIYTGFVYEGPGFIGSINRRLLDF
ncbi:MAG: quinone-dependent dihydroorotate dehydrogenase [Cytophagales bacterium]|nr:quinone-dependent dihydroorotate dehydrogenase [Cytophagales bacterium]MCA6388576.1 quinone-dependent dihydroorotate dehydrogenase [Cytophagales bacterium]MCA6393221.1 quinone-dependent dihydroorotate dehydrogenase [Cytophagales bacterium]MCA6397415.1 quinone-dependent dihydroorotate dehydrogenase [Cytophagales bacterium]MCA6401168.1 quinone-dependent dihydroorotate dehydrogenase [Cytophagales bacterium]